MRLRGALRCLIRCKMFAAGEPVLQGDERFVPGSFRSIHISLVARTAPSCATNFKPSPIRPSCKNEETILGAAYSRSSSVLLRT